MKYIISFIAIGLFSFMAQANPEITVSNTSSFCHWPQNANNGNNETFQGSCVGSVTQNADGTGNGAVRMVVNYGPGSSPYQSYAQFHEGNAPNLTCELEDTNGTQYNSEEWSFAAFVTQYTDETLLEAFNAALGSDDPAYDLDGDGVVTYYDFSKFSLSVYHTQVVYNLTCLNGVQQ